MAGQFTTIAHHVRTGESSNRLTVLCKALLGRKNWAPWLAACTLHAVQHHGKPLDPGTLSRHLSGLSSIPSVSSRMSTKPGHKIRGDVTRETIIEVAEQFWAEHGINSTSLRQISAAAGLSNPSSVQYHFGGRDGLLKAVFEHRLPKLDQRRKDLLALAERRGEGGELRTMIDCIYRPLVETVNPQGRHAYAAFLRQVLVFEPAIMVRIALTEVSPVSWRIADKIKEHLLLRLPQEIVVHRIWACTLTVLSVVIRQDEDTSGMPAEAAFLDALDMAVVALEQPLHPKTLALLSKAHP